MPKKAYKSRVFLDRDYFPRAGDQRLREKTLSRTNFEDYIGPGKLGEAYYLISRSLVDQQVLAKPA